MFSPKRRAQTAKQHTTNPPHSSYVPLILIDPFSAMSKSIFSHFSQSRVHTLTATDEQSEETEDGPDHFEQVLMDSGQCSKWVERTLDAGRWFSLSARVSRWRARAHSLLTRSLSATDGICWGAWSSCLNAALSQMRPTSPTYQQQCIAAGRNQCPSSVQS